MIPNRRKHFFINKPLQIRYMLFVTVPLLLICAIAILGFYMGIWGQVLEAFSDDQIRNDLLTASRMIEYEQARRPEAGSAPFSSLSFFKETEKLSLRQREVFKEILEKTNRSLLPKFLLILVLIAWGTIYISHKIAGPLFHFGKVFKEMAQGNYRIRVHLRKSDEAQSVAEEFNKALQNTDHLLGEIKNAAKEEEPAKAIAQIKDKLSHIQTSVEH